MLLRILCGHVFLSPCSTFLFRANLHLEHLSGFLVKYLLQFLKMQDYPSFHSDYLQLHRRCHLYQVQIQLGFMQHHLIIDRNLFLHLLLRSPDLFGSNFLLFLWPLPQSFSTGALSLHSPVVIQHFLQIIVFQASLIHYQSYLYIC